MAWIFFLAVVGDELGKHFVMVSISLHDFEAFLKHDQFIGWVELWLP